MNLTDCVGFSDSLVLPQQVKTPSGSYHAHGEKELRERNFGFDSLKSRLKRDMEEKAIFSVDSCQFTSGPYNFSDAPLFRPIGRMRTPPPAEQPEESVLTTVKDRSGGWAICSI